MTQIDRLEALGLFSARVPRYTSYPTAPVFSARTGSAFQQSELANLDRQQPISVYLHIPFCERLCWFCACRTQGTKTLSPVESYLEAVEAELRLLAGTIPLGLNMGRLHWGGGTPTILSPAMIHRLADAVKRVFQPTDDWEFSVEIDPTMVDRDKIKALSEQGMNRASIGIQDFDPIVQAAIGRDQPFEVTRRCVDDLRAAGIVSLNTDLVYGLPHQTKERQLDTVQKVLTLDPDRVAIFGYAHVPWMSKRQKLIDETALPNDRARYELATLMANAFQGAGMTPIGIDHFATPDDELARAQVGGRLRRNFQGYTADDCSTLIGLGASSISRLPGGYVQNAPATAAYAQRIDAGSFAGCKGHALSRDDQLRARAIEMLMCNFKLDRASLQQTFGLAAHALDDISARVAARYSGFAEWDETGLLIRPEGKALTRMIASEYDAYVSTEARFSQAS